MQLKIYQIDAFAAHTFAGNPAAVIPLDSWLADDLMQSIAEENNLSETAFFVPANQGFEIRWFTPTVEVNLCGHATLAAAFVLFHELGYGNDNIQFFSKSGTLHVAKEGDDLVLDFPSQPPEPCAIPQPVSDAFADTIITCLKAEDYIVVLKNEADVQAAKPNANLLKKLDLRGVVITAKSEKYDFVSRFFAPNYGIEEDPVTGSSFTQLAPYWAKQLGRTKLHARQISKRGGEVCCEVLGERVLIKGKATKYLEGTLTLNSTA